MKSIIIFRFYKHPRICLNRLKIIRKFNPNILIHGIYGGNENEIHKFTNITKDYLHSFYVVKNKSNEWKWKNFDLVLKEWYRDIGYAIDFDMAYVIEWDLLLFDSIASLYENIKIGDIGITGIVSIELIEKQWYWTSEETLKTEWEELLHFVYEKFNYSLIPLASLGPGLCFPKSFLADYVNLAIPELCHDEIRIPLFAQILNYPIKDTNFFNGWFDKKDMINFNCDNIPISVDTIKSELRTNGKKVFHPYRKKYLVE